MTVVKAKLHIEHLLLFIIFPISLVFNYAIYIKLLIGLLAVSYVIWISVKNKYFKFKPKKNKRSEQKLFLKQFSLKILLVVVLTTIITLGFYQEDLFNAINNKPFQYLIIIFVYIFFSVIPQEFVYRKFYFSRYQIIFKDKYKLIITNTFVFSLCHLFFENLLVMFITLIGGLIFSLSYYKFESFKYICIEHSFYGLWLYTIGLGGLLGFPVA